MNTRILILSGPTHEYIDPVRFIGNASSGRMGKALAEEAVRRGCSVEFVSGPVAPANLPELGNKGSIYRVVSADEMLASAAVLFPAADWIIFAAAVADYSPKQRLTQKKPKSEEEFVLRLRPTPDIAATLCPGKTTGQLTIGFALQTADGETHARRKLTGKRLDGIVLNTPATLGADEGIFSFLRQGADRFESWGRIGKDACARKIFDRLEQMARS